MDTIFANSSGKPPAAIAVIRVSGPDAFTAVCTLAGTLPSPRHATLRRLRDDAGSFLDSALVLAFPGPGSATGEDLVELHCHGGRAVVAAVERALGKLAGLRPAEPGEFTRRAVANGRIDLIEAEGLADLLAAETEAQRIAATGAAEGRISLTVENWITRIALLSAEVEAALDFAEEDDVADDPAFSARVGTGMAEVAAEITAVLSAPPVERLRDGIRVVLVGPPNSGKSTLLNLLAERDAAIVSAVAGTTRDRIEVPVARGGLPFLLTDTAGLAETDDPIESIGIGRAWAAMTTADVLLWFGDGSPPRNNAIELHSRSDLPGRGRVRSGRIAISAHDPTSIERLWAVIMDKAAAIVPRPDQMSLHQAQRRWCSEAAAVLGTDWDDLLIGAELLRVAHLSLATLLGRNATETMLDALFSRFCIGK